MKNRKLLLIVSLVLALTMSLGGTLAYLQDSDADVNTMVLGNVTITQNEQEWNADKTELVAFTQDKPMLPVVGDAAYNEYGDNPEIRRLTMANVVDKYVSVTNTGKSDAYVRTLIALEMGSVKFEDLGNILMANINKADGQEFDFPGTWLWPIDDVFTIDGQQYNVMVAVHENPVKPGETTIPSLLQVYLKSNANNQDLIDLDGNENGKYDVLVLSQAVQADGFNAVEGKTAAENALDTAFGVVDATNVADWFKGWADWSAESGEIGTPGEKWPTNDVPGTKVSTAAELAAAIAEGGSIALTSDIDIAKIDLTNVGADVVINGNNKKITTTEAYGIQVKAGKNITISNAEIVMTKNGDYLTYAAGLKIENGDYADATIKLENCKITMANTDWAYAVNMPASVKNLNLVIDNCELEGAIAVQCWGDNNTITITNSKLICNYTTNAMYTSYCVALQGDGANVAENNELVIKGCAFSYTGVDNFNSVIHSVNDAGTDNNVTVTNCTYGEKINKEVSHI